VQVSEKLAGLFKNLPHSRRSIAGTPTMYAPILVRLDESAGGVRIQIPGPEVNRPYGACVVLASAPLVQLFQQDATNETPYADEESDADDDE